MTVNVNLNDYVHVRLTPKGEALFDAHHRDLGLDPEPYRGIHKKADGRWRFQLWELFEIFGAAISMGTSPPFETTIEIEHP